MIMVLILNRQKVYNIVINRFLILNLNKVQDLENSRQLFRQIVKDSFQYNQMQIFY